MSDAHPTPRGDLMRRMAAIQVQIDLLRRSGKPFDQIQAEVHKLERQLVDLRPKMTE
jgi:hypothetical protein